MTTARQIAEPCAGQQCDHHIQWPDNARVNLSRVRNAASLHEISDDVAAQYCNSQPYRCCYTDKGIPHPHKRPTATPVSPNPLTVDHAAYLTDGFIGAV